MIKRFVYRIIDKYRQLFVIIHIEEAKSRNFYFIRNVHGDEINAINCRSLWLDRKMRRWRVHELKENGL